MAEIDSLEIKIATSSTEAVSALKSLSDALGNVQSSLKGLGFDGFGDEIKQGADAMDDLVDNADDVGDALEDAGKGGISFGEAIRANVISQAIISGVKALGSAVKDMAGEFIDSAADVKAETSQFQQTFGSFQGEATEAIGRVADESGILSTRLNTVGSSIFAFARSSGGSVEESMSLMETALQAAADSAAYYDRSLEDTSETLQSFLKGNFSNDAALGVSATEFTRNAAATELFGKKYNDLTEIQKQQTLLKMVTDAQELSGAMGQAAREADGWENVQGNLNEAWRQFQANVGAPFLESLIPIIQQITAGFQEWTASVDWAAFGDTIKGFVSVILDNGPTILSVIAGIAAGFIAWNVAGIIQTVITAVTGLGGVLPAVATGIKAITTAVSANWIGLIVAAIAGVVAVIVTLWNTNEDFRNAVIEIWENIKEVFSGAWEFIKGVWDAVQPYFAAIWEGIQTAFATVVEVLGGFFTTAWEAIKQVWDTVSPYFLSIWDSIQSIFSIVTEVLGGFFSTAWNVIKSVWDAVGPYFSAIWDGIKKVFSVVSKVLGGFFSAAWSAIKGVWTVATSYFQNIWNTIAGIFKVVESVLSGDFKGAWEAIKGVFAGWKDFFKGLWDILTGAFSNVWNAFADIGKNIVKGLWNGIQSLTGWIGQKVSGFINGIMSFFTGKKGFDEHSPSKWADKVGVMVSRGLGNGIDDGASEAVKAAQNMAARVKNVDFEPLQVQSQVKQSIISPVSAPIDTQSPLSPVSRDYDYETASNGADLNIINAIYATGERIIRAINEKDCDVNIDGHKLTARVTTIQRQQDRMYWR